MCSNIVKEGERRRKDGWTGRRRGRRKRGEGEERGEEGEGRIGKEENHKQPIVAVSCCGHLHAINSRYSNNLTKIFVLMEKEGRARHARHYSWFQLYFLGDSCSATQSFASFFFDFTFHLDGGRRMVMASASLVFLYVLQFRGKKFI